MAIRQGIRQSVSTISKGDFNRLCDDRESDDKELYADKRSVKGERAESRLLERICFDAYNCRIKTIRTESDWLTRDEKVAEKSTTFFTNNIRIDIVASLSYYYIYPIEII